MKIDRKEVNEARAMNSAFQVFILNAEGVRKAQKIAELYSLLLEDLEKMCGDTREMVPIKSYLEMACFLSKRAMSRHPANQQPPAK